MIVVSVLRNHYALHQLHDKIWMSGVRRSRIQYTCNVGVIHQRQCLPFSLEAGDHFFGVHSRLDDFDGNFASQGFDLFGHIHDAKTAFTNFLQELVSTDSPPLDVVDPR